jgi:hypothetical protein
MRADDRNSRHLRRCRMRMQFAKYAVDRDLRVWSEFRLLLEESTPNFRERVEHLTAGRGIEFYCQIGASHLGTERREYGLTSKALPLDRSIG